MVFVQIRAERAEDLPGIRRVNEAAFGTRTEADLVDALRARAASAVSLVADVDGEVTGHILLSPVTLTSDPALLVLGLAPMAVLPERQRQGIGGALVGAVLDAARQTRAAAVCVLGHAEYYPRFGFERASRFGIVCEYDVPDEVFMILELEAGALRGGGTIRYHPAFAEFA
jgi:putative acetyltransferase